MVSVYQHLQRLRGALEKEAAAQSKTPGAEPVVVPSMEKVGECVDTLVDCHCLNVGEKDVMKEVLRGVPPAALACMTVLAKHAEQQALAVEPVGDRVPVSPNRRDPKKLAQEKYREASRSLG